MYLKTLLGALLFTLPLLNGQTAQADEYLIISNLPVDVSEKQVRALVEVHGEVKSIACYNVNFSTSVKRSCHVLMWSKKQARETVEALNGNILQGKTLYSKEIYPVPCPDVLA